MPTSEREILFGKNPGQIAEIVSRIGLPRFAAAQILDWLYRKSAMSFSEMTNLSLPARQKLEEQFELGLHPPVKEQISADQTRKYLFATQGGKFIESAFIPDRTRNTLCVSTQVGCKMGCLFCATGKQGFQAQLSAAEILNQLRSLPLRDQVSNIVYMGMGEPLDNLEALMESLDILTADWGMGLSPRRITVSTIGIIPALQTFLERSQCHLAISLHSPFDEERRQIMPIQHVYPIREVISLLRKFDWSGQRRVSFEYIVFGGKNDSPAHVRELARILNGLRCRINLIRFHPIPGSPLPPTREDDLEAFATALNAKGIITTIRASRGQDIDAACGLLSTKSLIQRNRLE